MTQKSSLNDILGTFTLVALGALLLLSTACEQQPDNQQKDITELPSVNIAAPQASTGSQTLEFLRLQAEEGLRDAQYKYAYHLMISQESPSELVLAQDWFTKAAQQGHIEACYRLGNLLAQGAVDGIQNISAATHWLLRAANDGHSGAQYLLGKYCVHGAGVIQDPEKALEWLRLSAEQNHPSAQFLLARLYETGQGTPPDLQLAFKWYEQAAQAGHPAAQYKTAEMVEAGLGTAPNPAVARTWYAQAYSLGLSVQSKENSPPSSAPINVSSNTISFSEAGPQGPEGTQPRIGSRDASPEHSSVVHVQEISKPSQTKPAQNKPLPKPLKRNPPETTESSKEDKIFIPPTQPSLDFQSEKIKKENSPAELEYKIAENYANGGRLPADPTKAKVFYEHSADQGHPQALHKLALDHLNPPASEIPNVIKAITFLEQAASKGHPPSQHQLAEIYYTGMLGEPNYHQAFLWYRLAANNNNSDAQFRLGNMYHYGEGVEANSESAKKWLHLAASQNNQPALNLLQVIHQAEQQNQSDHSPTRTTADPLPQTTTVNTLVDEPADVSFQPPETAIQKLSPHEWMEKGLRIYNSQNQPSTESYRESYQCFVNATHGQIGDAWYYIGRMYDYGEGMKANPVKAFQCYLVAARDGNSRAQYSLGFMYETGYGCKKLPTEAYVWYAIAAQNGLTNARQTQLGLEKKLSSTEIQFAQNRLRTLQAYLQSYKEERPNRHIPFE